MKRALVMSFCAVSVAAMISSAALAQVDIALNLRYDDPNNTSAGGTWNLVAKTSDANGLAGISAYIADIDATGVTMGGIFGAGVIGSDLDPAVADFGGTVNVVYGQDLSDAGTVVAGVGTGSGSAGNIISDSLNNAAWNNTALIAQGTFGGTRPAFTTNLPSSGDTTSANNLDGAGGAVAAVIGLTNVRGDSVSVDGLNPGDANRDNVVNVAGDAVTLVANLGVGTTWDQGDFNSSGTVDVAGDAVILVANLGLTSTPPAVAAVPEPASVALALFGGAFALFGIRRRRSC